MSRYFVYLGSSESLAGENLLQLPKTDVKKEIQIVTELGELTNYYIEEESLLRKPFKYETLENLEGIYLLGLRKFYYVTGDLDKAKQVAKKALTIYEKHYGAEAVVSIGKFPECENCGFTPQSFRDHFNYCPYCGIPLETEEDTTDF